MNRSNRHTTLALRALTFATLALATASTFAVPSVTPTEKSPFATVVVKSFDKWDTDKDGILSVAEINTLVKTPDITGDEAAALASLKLVTRGKAGKTLPPLTRAYFIDYGTKSGDPVEDGQAAANATTDPELNAKSQGNATNWNRYFAASKARIAAAEGKAWRPEEISLDNLKQGPLGDCFFVATVGSLIIHRPDYVKSMVTERPDGKLEVAFPDASPLIVPPPTQAETAISGSTLGDGAWLAVLENAYGKLKSKLRGGSEDVQGTDILTVGGDSIPTINGVTGHKAKRISFPRTLEARVKEKDKFLADIREALLANQAAHLAMVAGCNPPTATGSTPTTQSSEVNTDDPAPTADKTTVKGTIPPVPPNISKRHVYAIVSFDPKTDTIEIWNPHSQEFTPKGTPGLANGYVTKKGRFTLPLAEAFMFYTSFTFEQNEAVKANQPMATTK